MALKGGFAVSSAEGATGRPRGLDSRTSWPDERWVNHGKVGAWQRVATSRGCLLGVHWQESVIGHDLQRHVLARGVRPARPRSGLTAAIVRASLRRCSARSGTMCCAAAASRGSLHIMDRAIQNPPPGFDDLTVHDQIEYVQTLWERIVTREDEVPVPEWHEAELDRRLAEYEAAPDVGRSWEEVEADLRVRLATRR